jgi:hypothetical protein
VSSIIFNTWFSTGFHAIISPLVQKPQKRGFLAVFGHFLVFCHEKPQTNNAYTNYILPLFIFQLFPVLF